MTYRDTTNHIPGDCDPWYDETPVSFGPKVVYSPSDVAVHSNVGGN